MFDPSSFAIPTPLAHADTSKDVLPRGGRGYAVTPSPASQNQLRTGVKVHKNQQRTGVKVHKNQQRTGVKVHKYQQRTGVKVHNDYTALEFLFVPVV
ncbi:hypothetical protein TNCV_488131 [Trichonephila clavipes]|nr:hypothetical protein TNCV_488131 [Trichonephila clavipes]